MSLLEDYDIIIQMIFSLAVFNLSYPEKRSL